MSSVSHVPWALVVIGTILFFFMWVVFISPEERPLPRRGEKPVMKSPKEQAPPKQVAPWEREPLPEDDSGIETFEGEPEPEPEKKDTISDQMAGWDDYTAFGFNPKMYP